MSDDRTCNRKACRKPGARHWNTSTRAWYCDECATAINRMNPRAPLCVSENDLPPPAPPAPGMVEAGKVAKRLHQAAEAVRASIGVGVDMLTLARANGLHDAARIVEEMAGAGGEASDLFAEATAATLAHARSGAPGEEPVVATRRGLGTTERGDLNKPCPHPARKGKHEVYGTSHGGLYCAACGARETEPAR